MLNLYTMFHCNLAFSSIPREHFPLVVERCYAPLLGLAESGIPVAVEMTAWTLKEVNTIDPYFIERLRSLWDEGRCEFIGSGYSQSIFPLVPTDVNRWNLELGNKYYLDLLGRRPKIALVNEQTFSRGIVDLYREAGYEAIIMDWNNSFQHNRYPLLYKYLPQRAAGLSTEVEVIWSHSIAFQKFQRCVHGEISEAEYFEYLFSHAPKDGDEERGFTAYSNDAEVFGYRPGGEPTAADEHGRMARLLRNAAEDPRVRLTTPGRMLESLRGSKGAGNIIRLESAETPVVCKKQEKYNPLRWAASGRDSIHVNTECHRVYNNLKALIRQGALEKEPIEDFKEVLCDLWGSDYRTNTIDEKYAWFQNRLGWLKMETERLLGNHQHRTPLLAWVYGGNPVSPALALEGEEVRVDGASMGAEGRSQVRSSESELKVSTPAVIAEFLPNKGYAIKSLVFPSISKSPLLGTLPHGHYEDMRLGADYFSGHLIHTSREGKQTADLGRSQVEVKEEREKVSVLVKSPLDIGVLWKRYDISKTEPEVVLTYRLKVNGLTASSLRAGIFTLVPSSFDRDSLWFETVNGGSGPERFILGGHSLAHEEPVSQGVSASSCLGATEGWLRIGDREKAVEISTDKARLYTVPMLRYMELTGEDSFFLRVYHSLGEFDDTAWWVWRGFNEAVFTIRAVRS